MPDISQAVILEKLKIYLTLMNRDRRSIDALNSGYCSGFSALYLITKFIQFHPTDKKDGISPDNYAWLKKTLDFLSTWTTSHPPSAKDLKILESHQFDIEKLISSIVGTQKSSKYWNIGQGDLSRNYLQDTLGNCFKKDFTVASLLSSKELCTSLDAIIPVEGYVLISSHNHDISLVRNGDFYYLYDSNDPEGEQIFSITEKNKLTHRIFSAFSYDDKSPSLIGFRSFKILKPGEAKEFKLPSEEDRTHAVLRNLASSSLSMSAESLMDRTSPINKLIGLAVTTDSPNTLEYINKQLPSESKLSFSQLNRFNFLMGDEIHTNFLYAAGHGFDDTIKWFLPLIKTDSDRIMAVDDLKNTALIYAAANGKLSSVNLILDSEYGKEILNSKNAKNHTALSSAALYGREDVVKLLCEQKEINFVDEAFTIALLHNQLACADILLTSLKDQIGAVQYLAMLRQLSGKAIDFNNAALIRKFSLMSPSLELKEKSKPKPSLLEDFLNQDSDNDDETEAHIRAPMSAAELKSLLDEPDDDDDLGTTAPLDLTIQNEPDKVKSAKSVPGNPSLFFSKIKNEISSEVKPPAKKPSSSNS